MMSSAPSKQGRLGVVNGLRGIAILWVIYHHLFGSTTSSGFHAPSIAGLPIPVFAPLSNGWQGVGLFFVLSGFVLYLPYASGKRRMTGFTDVREFYKRRFFRLFPLFYLNVLVSLIYFVRPEASAWSELREMALLLTATFSFTSDQYFPRVNWVLWSLGIEVWFSAAMPLLLYIRQRLGIRVLVAGTLVVAFATRWAGWTWEVGDVLKGSVPARLDDFVLGMLAAHWFVRGGPSRRVVPAMLAGGATLLYVGFMVWDLAWMHVWPVRLVAVTGLFTNIGFFLVLTAALTLDGGVVYKVLANRFFQVSGMMCYSLYVWHGIAKVGVFGQFDVDHYHPFLLALYFVLTAAIAALTYRYVEFGRVADWRALFRPEPPPPRREEAMAHGLAQTASATGGR